MLKQGMRVGVHYRTGRIAAESLSNHYRNLAMPLPGDLGSEQGCVELARAQREQVGGCDVLVHSAGIWNAGPIDSITGAQLDEMFRVNVHSAFFLVRELLPMLRANAKGSVVFIGSTAGQRGEARHGHYAASKGALQALAMSLAVELAPAVRTNVVSPGWIRTPMAEATLARVGPILEGTIPNKRVGEIADVVNAVLYLASDASSHLLGENLGVSGGSLLIMPRGQIAAYHP
jgi:3-oxoacyl-[acyl-carrier protein] reductase